MAGHRKKIKPKKTRSPRVTWNKYNETVTISGLSYGDARCLLTSAYLGQVRTMDKCEEEVEETQVDGTEDDQRIAAMNFSWIRRMRWIVERLEAGIMRGIASTFPPKVTRELSLKESLLARKADRDLYNDLFKLVDEEYNAKRSTETVRGVSER